MTKTTLITGITCGIGLATAKRFSKEGTNLILCGRRLPQLKSLQKELSLKVKAHILCFDVRNKSAVFAALKSISSEFSKIEILINNAGNAQWVSC